MKQVLLKLIKFYQNLKSFRVPFLAGILIGNSSCRFNPVCSEYNYQAISKYGIIKGSLLGLRRIFKCHPWNKGGGDPLN
ncbi:membrane protein insertion efficiency factor YidD [Patescibacteria group bacterium]